MNEIEKILRDLKGRHGINASQVAEALGVSKVTVSRWRSGSLVPSASKLAALRSFYETQMTGAPTVPPAVDSRDGMIVRMAALGHDYSEISKVFEISRERVRQIVSQHGAPRRRR
ncbi:helix-turn-helix transcriptional regulator [Aquamicrobium lusatiense]|uniref:helix-turn-helix domain-containing protein n=1 Tax=Aquamicrobium lusatiense TaxID=89772 RepID=UPI002454168F|nr:helix-turn-helix transcriptional regulator [Aquamicrobium lusatiense]MDH4990864.1 helix-turn-helix transcriptional regulator [Aquamicrobium lusatiense]